MAETIVYFLPEADRGDAEWVRIHDGQITARGSSSSIDVDRPSGCRVVAIVPAGSCAVEWHDVAAMPVKQARAVARLAAMTGRLDPANDLYVATEARFSAEGQIATAIVSIGQMQRWMTTMSALQILPDAIVPAGMLLPKPVDGFAKAIVGAQAVARDAHYAFPADRSMLTAVARDAAIMDVHQTLIEERLMQFASDPTINLADAGRNRFAEGDGLIKRRLAVWLLLLGLACLADPAARLIAYHSQVGALNAASLAEAQTVAPSLSDLQSAKMALTSGRYAIRFSDVAVTVFAAVDFVPDARMVGLSYTGDGRMTFSLARADATTARQIEARLRRSGFVVRSDRAANGNSATRFVVSPP
jgi:general secretion pathway protein L